MVKKIDNLITNYKLVKQITENKEISFTPEQERERSRKSTHATC